MFQFPASPIVGQLFTPAAGISYRWSGTAWFLVGQMITLAEGDLRYIKLVEKAAALGVATLDGGIKIPVAQIPDLSATYLTPAAAAAAYIPLAQKAAANGVASLDGAGKVPAAQLPATASGQILQVAAVNDVGSSASSTAFATLNAITVSFTPKSTTSRLLIEVGFYASIGNVAAANTTGSFRLFESGTATPVGSQYDLSAASSAGGNTMTAPACIRVLIPNASLATRTFVMQGKTNNAAAQVSGVAMVWSITEIQN